MRKRNSAIALTWLFTTSFYLFGGKAASLFPPFDGQINPSGSPSLPPHAGPAASKQQDVGVTLPPPPSPANPASPPPTPQPRTFLQPSISSHPEPPSFPDPPDALPPPAPPRSRSLTAPSLPTLPASPSLQQPPFGSFEQPPVTPTAPPPSPPSPPSSPPPHTPAPPPDTQQLPSWCVHEGVGGACDVDLGVLTSLPGGPTTDTRRLLAAAAAAACDTEQPGSCPASWLEDTPEWMRGRVYCPGSRLDQLVTCLARNDNEQACGGVASDGGNSGPGSAGTPLPPAEESPCVWTDQTLLRPLSLPASAVAADQAVDGPARLMTAVADALIANFAFSYRIRVPAAVGGEGRAPYSYCTAKWTLNEQLLNNTFNSYTGWQKDDLLYGTNGSTRTERNTGGAVALASRVGHQAFTGTSCPVGSKFFWWSARCTRAKTQAECPQQVGAVQCAWSNATATCRPVGMDALGALLDEQGTDPWVRRFREMAATCRGGTGGVGAGGSTVTNEECTARGMPYTFNHTRMAEYGSLTPELFTSGTPLPPELPQLPPQPPPAVPPGSTPSLPSFQSGPSDPPAPRPPRPPTAPRGLSIRAPVAAPMPRPLGPPRPPAPPPAPPRPPDIPYAPRLTRGSGNSSPSASISRWHMGRQSTLLVSLATCLSALLLALL